MQNGWVERHGRGWRGGWRENGKKHYTPSVHKKGDAHALLKEQTHRLEQGRRYQPNLTLAELVLRFHAQHDASQRTNEKITGALKQPLTLWGNHQADDLTPEMINGWLVTSDLKAATKQTYLGALRQVYAFGITNRLVQYNPARHAKTPTVRRSDSLCPFESWDEVEAVALEAGSWGAMIIIAADTGARPGELQLLQHTEIQGRKVNLPGTKTRRARRIVTLTKRGQDAYNSISCALHTPLVFHTNGHEVDWHNWRNRVWQPALELAGLQHRGPYQLRHTFAYFSLRAGVPISDLSVEMGHESIRLTHETYGHWSDEMGDRAANLRHAWAEEQAK